MGIFLMILMIFMYAGQTMTCRAYSTNYPGEPALASPVFSIVSGLSVAIITFAFAGFSFAPRPLTLILGLLNAGALIGYNYFFVMASQSGPYSILITISTMGAITIPTFFGVFAMGDKISVIQYVALAVLLCSIYFVCQKKGEVQKPTKKFLLFCLCVFGCNGAYATLMDLQQELTGAGDKEEMVILTFFITGVVSAVTLLAQKKDRFLVSFKQSRMSLTFLVICSITAAVAVNLLTIVIPLINRTIFFSVKSSGVLACNIFGAAIFFKEKISLTNIIGAVFMCAGLVCLSLF